jgi:hypothetical protein
MLGGLGDQSLFVAPSSAPLAALLVVPPGLLVCYISYRLAARQLRPAFSLRPLEALELQRALLLYEMASKRIETDRPPEKSGSKWRRILCLVLRLPLGFPLGLPLGLRRETSRPGEEFEDLQNYLRDLRSTIVRLRRRPFKRYKNWVHTVSAQSALGRSLACYILALAFLVALFCASQPILWAQGLDPGFKTYVLWQAVKGRLLLANWVTANFAAIAAPLFYAARRVSLNRQHGAQITALKEFAGAGTERLTDERQADAEAAAYENPPPAADQDDWSRILGVSPAATIDEVKQAYKGLIKKNHPDRVSDMSPSFVKLAEAETKKLNVAYAEALISLQR